MTSTPKGGGGSPTTNQPERLISPFPRRGVITCNACNQDSTGDIQEFPLADGGIRLALICPNCNAQYPIASITANGISLRSRLSRLRKTGKGQTPEYHALQERYRNCVKRLSGDAKG